MQRIEIVIVDDQPYFRAGLHELLQIHEDIEVLGEARDGVEAIATVKQYSPDVVIMDISMPNMSGTDATKEILRLAPNTKVIALSIHSGKRYVNEMLDVGAKGYLLKDNAPDELVGAIRKVARGDIYLDSTITSIALGKRDIEEESGSHSVLYTKLHRPAVTHDVIVRSRIVDHLERNKDKPLSLISAPAGYGKSMAVSQWLEYSRTLHTWLSLDEEHNELRLFLRYLKAAVEKLFPGAFVKTDGLLQAGELPPIQEVSHSVINDMDGIEQDFILVLDDYHRIREKKIHQLVDRLLQYPPEHLHLSILTRMDPPLQINPLSAHGRMAELRMAELSFTDTETAELFQKIHDTTLKLETARAFYEKTEGWVVALRIAFLRIRKQEEAEQIITSLKGDSYALSNYFLEEVIVDQPVEIQELLLITSVLNRFCVGLIDAVRLNSDERNGTFDGNGFVRWLIKSNLFIINLDDQRNWFRYHHLIQGLLKKRLVKQKTAEEISQLHEHASRWFESQNFIEEAISHMLDAGNPVEACKIVERHRWAELDADKWYVVQRWIEKIPVETRLKRPILLLTECWPLYENFHLAKIPPILEQVEAILKNEDTEQQLRGELNFFYGAINYWAGNATLSLEYFKTAQGFLLGERKLINGLLQLLSGLARSMSGKGEQAIRILKEYTREAESMGGIFVSRLRGGLFFITFFLGNLDQARKEAQQAQIVARKSGIAYSDAWNSYMEACTDFHSGNLEDALRHFSEAVEQRYILHTRAAIDSVAGLVLTQHFLGQKDAALASLDLMMKYARELEDPLYMSVVLSCQARLALLCNDLTNALNWERTTNEAIIGAGLFMWLEVPAMTQARVLIACDTPECLEKARGILEEILQISRGSHFTNQVIDGLVLKSLLLEKQGHDEEALEALSEVVALAEPGRWIRPFLEAGNVMHDMLKALRNQGTAVYFIEMVLDHMDRMGKDTSQNVAAQTALGVISDKFSLREKEIIRLMAQGLRNKEIASILFVAEGTIKKHIYNVCQKLNVNNRIQMINMTRKLGLIRED